MPLTPLVSYLLVLRAPSLWSISQDPGSWGQQGVCTHYLVVPVVTKARLWRHERLLVEMDIQSWHVATLSNILTTANRD